MSKKYPRGVWISIDKGTPPIKKGIIGDIDDHSEAVLIIGWDNCKWLAYWDGEVWHNANTSDKIWMNKEYVVAWLRIPKYLKKGG